MEYDKILRQAAELIVNHQSGSSSLLQIKFTLGYNRAGKIIDQLEGLNIVGEFLGAKPREVKVKNLKELNEVLKPLNL